MKTMRLMVGVAIAAFAASLVMFVVSFWTDEALGGPVYTMRLALVIILVCILIPLVSRMGKGTLPRRLWSLILIAMLVDLIPVTLETINAYAGREVFSQDLIFLFYLAVFIPVLVAIGVFYFGFKALGFEFKRESLYKVIPSLVIFIGVTVAVLIIPMAISSGDMAVKISDIISLVIQMMALSVVSLMAVTIGKGKTGRPYVYLSLALVFIIIQTILTAHIRLVGIMTTTEAADAFVHLGYLFLILAAYFQYELTAEPVL